MSFSLARADFQLLGLYVGDLSDTQRIESDR